MNKIKEYLETVFDTVVIEHDSGRSIRIYVTKDGKQSVRSYPKMTHGYLAFCTPEQVKTFCDELIEGVKAE